MIDVNINIICEGNLLPIGDIALQYLDWSPHGSRRIGQRL